MPTSVVSKQFSNLSIMHCSDLRVLYYCVIVSTKIVITSLGDFRKLSFYLTVEVHIGLYYSCSRRADLLKQTVASLSSEIPGLPMTNFYLVV